jgi:hypothetical protein
MKIILSRYNHDISWLKDYTDDYVLYDRSEVPIEGAIAVPNIGSDIYDKLTYIIDNYENLPDCAIYTKANLFKYISRDEFDRVKDNRTFTPLHTQHHKTYLPVCRYAEDGLYEEINNRWFLNDVPTKYVAEYDELIGNEFTHQEYKPFAPGSNYIIPKENILKRPREFYEKLRSFLGYERYPGEAFLIERDMYNIFK